MARRFKHNLSNYNLTTTDMGRIIPVNCVEALPGDTIQQHTNVLIRVSPLAAPVMHPVTARIHHFFVPNRLVWDGWEDFITGGPDGMNADEIPTITTNGNKGGLADHFGIPPVAGMEISALPFRAYQLIWNEYYRDQDLGTEVPPDTEAPSRCSWEKDYFTSARPWTQKGPEVTIPLGSRAPVSGIGKLDQTYTAQGQTVYESGGIATTYDESAGITRDNPQSYFNVEEDPTNPGYPNIYADLANATGADINDVRKAFALQRYQEARARYGSRYTEYLRYLGVANPRDARLQRPEFLGGGQAQINFSEVLQTGPETGQEPSTEFGVGDMYGHGIAAMRSNKYRRFIEEHGYIISLLSVRPKAIYQNGIHRSFLRKHKEDFYQRELAHIGQQAIHPNEVFADPSHGDDEVFGYCDRYREYREQPSVVTGEFRDLLDYWHLARQFDEAPVLNQQFVRCEPSKRIHNEQTQDALWIMCQNRIIARRIVDRSAYARIL